MITIHVSPDAILGAMLAAALIAMMLARVWTPRKKEHKPKTGARSPKEVAKLKKELARIQKALK